MRWSRMEEELREEPVIPADGAPRPGPGYWLLSSREFMPRKPAQAGALVMAGGKPGPFGLMIFWL
jgi:hypothetical protein